MAGRVQRVDAFRHRVGEAGIEVVGPPHPRVLAEQRHGQAGGDLGEVHAVAAVDLDPALAARVPHQPDARRPVVVEGEAADVADQPLPLGAQAHRHGQVVGHGDAILREEAEVGRRAGALDVEVGAGHPVDLAVHRIRQNRDQGAAGRPLAVGQRDGRTGDVPRRVGGHVLGGEAVAELMPAEQVGRAGTQLPAVAVADALVAAPAADRRGRRDGLVDDLPLVHQHVLLQVARRVRERGLHQPARPQHPLVEQPLVVAAEVERAEGARALVAHRRGGLRSVAAGGGVAEGGQLEPVRTARHQRQLAGVGDRGAVPVDLAEHLERKAGRGDEGGSLLEAARSHEVEQPVADDASAEREAELARRLADRVDRSVGQLQQPPVALQRRRREVAEDAAGELVRTAAGHRRHQPASGLLELGVGAGAAHRDLLDELGSDAGAERAVVVGVDAECSVAGIGEVDPVDHVLILESAGAGDRRVGRYPRRSMTRHPARGRERPRGGGPVAAARSARRPP